MPLPENTFAHDSLLPQDPTKKTKVFYPLLKIVPKFHHWNSLPLFHRTLSLPQHTPVKIQQRKVTSYILQFSPLLQLDDPHGIYKHQRTFTPTSDFYRLFNTYRLEIFLYETFCKTLLNTFKKYHQESVRLWFLLCSFRHYWLQIFLYKYFDSHKFSTHISPKTFYSFLVIL